MNTWVRYRFSDPKLAMTTICLASLAMAACGLASMVLGVLLGH